MEALVLY